MKNLFKKRQVNLFMVVISLNGWKSHAFLGKHHKKILHIEIHRYDIIDIDNSVHQSKNSTKLWRHWIVNHIDKIDVFKSHHEDASFLFFFLFSFTLTALRFDCTETFLARKVEWINRLQYLKFQKFINNCKDSYTL